VYGKIKRITRGLNPITNVASDRPDLEYSYDASGNRIAKITKTKTALGVLNPPNQWIYTYYERDAQGNVMAVYDQSQTNSGNLFLNEQHVYGSSRLGLLTRNINMQTPTNLNNVFVREAGNKAFEFGNHLGNVLTVVSDRKLQIASTSNAALVGSFNPDILSANDYYSFGAPMPGRNFNAVDYRYGFNGKENDNEVKGTGNQQDYGMRIYDPRLGKFLSVDPITDEYPELTPYQFASNRPIDGIDRDGLEFTRYDLDSNDPNVKEMAKSDGVTNYRDSKNYQIFNDARSGMSGSGGVVEGMMGGVLGEGLISLGKYLYKSYKATKIVQKVTKAEQVLKNAEKGAKFEKKVVEEVSTSQTDVVEQITVKTKSGTKTRIDVVGKDKATGKVKLTEAKSSQTAPLTKNQKTAFPEIEQSGGTVVGEGKPPYVGGTEIPPTKVEIVRPK